MGFDSDYNLAELIDTAHWFFQACESFFCIYFTFELSVRFMSFKIKRNCLRDAWFTFDGILVTLMVSETWVLPLLLGGGKMPIDVQFLRLLRLLRLARMVRLLRGLPELLALVKAMGAAIRSVSTVCVLLLLLLYVFAILHRMMLGGIPGKMTEYFGSIPLAMTTLFYVGTLGDSIWVIWLDLWQIGTEGDMKGYIFLGVFFAYVFLSMFTILNMLIGVLCEVVGAVSEQSKEETLIDYVRETLLKVLDDIDKDGNGMVSRVEFSAMCADPRCRSAFEDLDVDMDNFEKMTGFLFDPDDPDDEDKELGFADMLKRVLTMRGTNTARVFDIMELNKHITRQCERLGDRLTRDNKRGDPSRKDDISTPIGAGHVVDRLNDLEQRFENRMGGVERAVQSLAEQVGALTKSLKVDST
jgi:voltage-gated sodium channel